MTNYYFVGASLPQIKIGAPLEMTFADYDQLLKLNLNTGDYRLTQAYRRYWDIRNAYALWTGEPLDPHGNLTGRELEEALFAAEELPGYVQEYLRKYVSKESRLENFPELIATYFRVESQKANGALKFVLDLERQLRFVLVCFRAKRLGRNMLVELQYEDPEEPFIAQLLAYKDSKTFEPPERFVPLKEAFEKFGDSPLELYQAVCEFEFNELNQYVGLQSFSMDRLIVYLVQLIMAEQWLELDKKKGLEIVDRFVKEKA